MSLLGEYWSSKLYFSSRRENFPYEEDKKLLIYWKLALMICDHWLRSISDHTNTHESVWLQKLLRGFPFIPVPNVFRSPVELAMNSQQGDIFRYPRFHNFVREKCLILLNWHQFLNELVILNLLKSWASNMCKDSISNLCGIMFSHLMWLELGTRGCDITLQVISTGLMEYSIP